MFKQPRGGIVAIAWIESDRPGIEVTGEHRAFYVLWPPRPNRRAAPKLVHGGGELMIARHWRGWTRIQDAGAYEDLLKGKVLPELRQIEGYRGGYVLRLDGPEEIEFVVVNLFDSLEAVKQFAGPEYTTPIFEPEAKKLLCRIEPVANHYDVRAVHPAGIIA